MTEALEVTGQTTDGHPRETLTDKLFIETNKQTNVLEAAGTAGSNPAAGRCAPDSGGSTAGGFVLQPFFGFGTTISGDFGVLPSFEILGMATPAQTNKKKLFAHLHKCENSNPSGRDRRRPLVHRCPCVAAARLRLLVQERSCIPNLK